MNARLVIRAAGPGVTVQDAGRFGFSRFGVTPAGPMDEGAYLAATRAVHARAAIEVSLGGAVFEADIGPRASGSHPIGAPLAAAVAGGGFDMRLDDYALPGPCVFALAPGQRLAIRAGEWGAWTYVAIGAAFGLAPTLGSLASHTRSGLGSRPLAAGDTLALRDIAPDLAPPPAQAQALIAPWLARDTAPIRVLPGPQADYFTPEAFAAFLGAAWRVGQRSDRMAYALEGPPVAAASGHDIVSDGVAFGAIQIPGSGAPFVLMADRQPTGGYPKIATVIGPDLGRLAQLRPGETLRFCAVTWEEAVEARRAFYAALDAGARFAPLAPDLSTETLLTENLVGGVISAREFG